MERKQVMNRSHHKNNNFIKENKKYQNEIIFIDMAHPRYNLWN